MFYLNFEAPKNTAALLRSTDNSQLSTALGGFAFARARSTATRSARATNRAAIRAHAEIDGPEVTATMLAVRFASACARCAI